MGLILVPTGKIGIPPLIQEGLMYIKLYIVKYFQGEVSMIRARLILSFIPHRHVSQCSIHMHVYWIKCSSFSSAGGGVR